MEDDFGLAPDFAEFLLASMPGHIAVLDTNLQYIYVSPGAVKNPEIRKWILGKTDLEYCHYRNKPIELGITRMEKLREVLATGKSDQWVERTQDEAGDISIISRNIFRVHDNKKDKTYLVGYGVEITDIIKLQEDLQKKNDFLDLVLNTSPHLIFVKDSGNRFLMVNDATVNIFGLSREEILMKPNEEIHSTNEEVEIYNKVDKKVFEEGVTVRAEEPFTKANGFTEWYDTIKTPLFDNDGVKKLLGISTNITEQKKNASQIRHREHELIDAQELTSSGNWRYDIFNKIFECSPGLYRLLEIPDNTELKLEDITSMCEPGLELTKAIERASESGDGSKLELIINTSTSRKSIIATVRLQEQNQISGKLLFGTMLDVTEQKKIENELRYKEQRLNLVSKLGRNGSFEFDLKDNSVEWSPGTFEIFEKDIKTGSPTVSEHMEHVHPEDRHIVENVLHLIQLSKEHITAEYRILTYTGKIKYVKIITQPEFDSEGKVRKIIGSTNDITEQKNTERELRLHRQNLEEAQDLARLGSWRLYFPGNEIWWSHGCYKIWERDIEKGPPSLEDFQKTLHPEDQERIAKSVEVVLATGVANVIEYRIITESGLIKHVFVRSKSAYKPDGSVDYLFGTLIDITELKEAEANLRKSEDRLNEAQKLARIGSWEYDYLNNEVFWSEGHFKLWERDPLLPALGFEEYLETIHPEDRKQFELKYKILAEFGGREEIEYRVILPSGRIAYMQSVAIAELNAEGRLKKLYGTVIDVSERRETENKIRLSEESLAEAQTLSRMGSWEYDLSEQKLAWSTGMYDLWKRNKTLSPPRFREFLNSVHPNDRQKIRELFKEVYETRIAQELEFRIRTDEDEWLYTYARVFARSKSNGDITSIHGTIMDISERKRNEELLRESERSLVEAQEMSRSGNFTIKIDGSENYWSPGMYKLTEWKGNTPPTLQEFFSWIETNDLERLKQFHSDLIQNSNESEIEYAITTPSGKQLIVLARAKAVKDENGNVILISGTATDITQQAAAQKLLIEMRDRSEEMIRAKEYFLANISHELKTPLNGILGMARLLQKTDLNNTQRKYTDILNSTAGNLLVIINDILDVAKIESGKLALENIPFDPFQIADQAVQVQLYKAEEKDLILRHIHIGAPMPSVTGDPYRLNQVLLNLLSNAIKFTKRGEVVLTHRIIAETQDIVTIEFSVEDTGIGILPEKADKIFESFMQIHDKTNEHYGGTGLGLTISRTLVEMQNGTIHVESEPGKGSRFYFTIPYQKSTHQENSATDIQRIDIKNLGALKILLAEDNRVNQFITEAMLLDWGFKVDVADNGIEALELIKNNEYDLVLMDIQMPGMSGIEATKAIRVLENPRKARVPIIALTANPGKNAQRKFIAEGMNDCVIKPFKEETLFRRIIMQLEGEERFKIAFKQKRFPLRKKPVPSGVQLYDLDLLRKDTRNNPAFIIKMLTIFIDTIPAIVERMREHYAKGEMDAISTLAHKIKPTLDGTGISSLHDTIRNIENYREKKRTSEQMAADLDRLEEVIGVVTREFHVEIEKLNH
jgi:PAS domain S-box-containing protein